jgi:hypothetical protein
VANRLTGVRLGRHERFLLSHAGSSQGITPLVIDPAEAPRSTQQGLLRAALKLESAGLIERHPLYKEGRVRDPRRERPHFHADRFWTYTDPRRQYVRRIAIWRTSFGEAIHQEFLVELQLAHPIRWDDRRVAGAEAWARRHPRDGGLIRDLVEQQDDRFRDRPLEQEEAREERREYLPPAVRSSEDQQRWLLAVGLARREKRNLGSERLLQAGLELYGSARPSEELRARLGPGCRSPELSHNALGGWRLREEPESGRPSTPTARSRRHTA